MTVTRFAPSPTGPMHLGHAYSAMVAHDLARAGGGTFQLRIDDLDGARVRAAWRTLIDDDLAWLDLRPDAPALVQSQRTDVYTAAFDQLRDAGLAYPCFCTRGSIITAINASVAAPHGPDGPCYPGTCRSLSATQANDRLASGETAAWRLDMAAATARAGMLTWHDALAGLIVADAAAAGDVVLVRRDGVAAYHLASTVDDAAQAITLVVRGADLLAATHIHRLLQALLGLPTPHYHHHALIGGATGRRLAKRDDAASIGDLRRGGVDPVVLLDTLRRQQLPLGFCWVAP